MAPTTESQPTSTIEWDAQSKRDLAALLKHLTSLKDDVKARKKTAVSYLRTFGGSQRLTDFQDRMYQHIRSAHETMYNRINLVRPPRSR